MEGKTVESARSAHLASFTPTKPTTFISYSHDSPEHEARVLTLADRLIAEGVDCILDQYHPAPPEGWPKWMDRQIRDATSVLMVCTETYYRRVMGEEKQGTGRGVGWESTLIYTYLYENVATDDRFIPVLLPGGVITDIPAPVRGRTHYRTEPEDEYEKLYRRLTNQPLTPKPALGVKRVLPPQPRVPATTHATAHGNTTTDSAFRLSVAVSVETLTPPPAFENIPVLVVTARNIGLAPSYIASIDLHATVDGKDVRGPLANQPDDALLNHLNPALGDAIDVGRRVAYRYRLKTLILHIQASGAAVTLVKVAVQDEVGHVYEAAIPHEVNAMIGEADAMEYHTVSSSNLREVGYSKGTRTLEVRFHNGNVYRYSGVPETIFRGLLVAPSKGSYLHLNVKIIYPYTKIA